MKIYNYHDKTKEYISTSEAAESPLEKGKYLIPAYATATPPMETKEGFTQVFNENMGTWEYKKDNRGKNAYNTKTKEKVKIDYIGELKDGYTFEEPGEFDYWDGRKWTRYSALYESALKSRRFARLEEIFNKKTVGLKKLAIDKPWMTNEEAINNQYRIYEEMYKNAKNGLYDTATNDAIITANETMKAKLAPVTLLLNSVRGVIEKAIEMSDANASAMLDAAEAVSLKANDITAEKIDAIKKQFGIA